MNLTIVQRGVIRHFPSQLEESIWDTHTQTHIETHTHTQSNAKLSTEGPVRGVLTREEVFHQLFQRTSQSGSVDHTERKKTRTVSFPSP